MVLKFKAIVHTKFYLLGFLAKVRYFLVAILLSLLKSRYLSLVLGVESLGWWDGVKATIKLPLLPFLEVCSIITPLVTLAKSSFHKNLAGMLFAWLLATFLLFGLGLSSLLPSFLFF